jgi:hypothetical protein
MRRCSLFRVEARRVSIAAFIVCVLTLSAQGASHEAHASGSSGSGSGGSGSGGSGSNSGKGSGSSTTAKPPTTKNERDDDDDDDDNDLAGSTVRPPSTSAVPLLPSTVVGSPTSASAPDASTSSPISQPPTGAPSTTAQFSTRIDRSVRCGSRTLRIEIRNDRELRIQTWISPQSDISWRVTLHQDRRLVWKGSAQRGRIDRRIPNLRGAELISIRLIAPNGSVCGADVTVPGT